MRNTINADEKDCVLLWLKIFVTAINSEENSHPKEIQETSMIK